MRTNLLVIAGLDDRDHFGPFIDNCREQGINAEVYLFGWQEKDKTLKALKQRLLRRIDEMSRVIVIGTSAGGCAAAWALQQRPKTVIKAINVCGALKLPRESHLNRFFSHRYEVLFNEMLSQLKANAVTDKRLVSIRPPYDGIVRRSALEFGKAKIIEIVVPIHPAAIHYALKHTVPKLLAS